MLVGAALLIVAAIGWIVWDAQNRQWIMTFEGERISTADFRFFSVQGNVPINDDSRQSLMSDLLNSLTIMHRAEALGLGLTPDERAELIETAAHSRAMMNEWNPGSLDFISDERIAEIAGSIGILVERLMDHYIPDYPTDTEEFAADFDSWLEDNEDAFSSFNVLYLSAFTEEELESARHQAVYEGVEFADIEGGFSTNIDEHGMLWPVDIDEFVTHYGLWEIEEEIRALEEGEWSRVFFVGGFYYLIYVETKVDPDIDEFRAQFIWEQRVAEFVELLGEWVEESDYSINDRVFETIV